MKVVGFINCAILGEDLSGMVAMVRNHGNGHHN